MTQFIQVVTTAPDRELAESIATELVNQRLAACVQILGPISSLFHWQGKIESADEWLCLAKARADRFTPVEKLIRQLHPYDVPEVIATPISHASVGYANWLHEELSADGK